VVTVRESGPLSLGFQRRPGARLQFFRVRKHRERIVAGTHRQGGASRRLTSVAVAEQGRRDDRN
jgi:hypothetical protein